MHASNHIQSRAVLQVLHNHLTHLLNRTYLGHINRDKCSCDRISLDSCTGYLLLLFLYSSEARNLKAHTTWVVMCIRRAIREEWSDQGKKAFILYSPHDGWWIVADTGGCVHLKHSTPEQHCGDRLMRKDIFRYDVCNGSFFNCWNHVQLNMNMNDKYSAWFLC